DVSFFLGLDSVRQLQLLPTTKSAQVTPWRLRLLLGGGRRQDLLDLSYSIASSTMASSPGGMVRPSVLAVLRLMTNSNLVDCITGRSAGFSPLRMRPA